MRIAGHRGLPRQFPDNTLEGITAAIPLCDYVELDVRRSLDGVKVLSHDPTIEGVDVASTAWVELKKITVGDGFHPTTFEAVLSAVGDFPLDIEIKNSPLEPGFDAEGAFACEVAAMARPIDAFTCFFWPTVDVVKASMPAVHTGLLIDQGGSITEAARHASSNGHAVLAPHWTLLLADEAVSRSLVLEFEIATWTVDDAEVAARLADLGIDSLISNDPVGIRNSLGLAPPADHNRRTNSTE